MSPTNTISVVGGGWSFAEVDHAKVPGYVIAANEAGLLLQKGVREIVSMDRLWTENRWARLVERKTRTWIRRSALQNVADWLDHDWVKVFECDHKTVAFSETPDRLNGTSSGTCALNLAYLLRPRELYLFGFDMCKSPSGKPYWYPSYEWTVATGGTSSGKYQAWAAEFNTIALAFASIGTKVVNVSAHSKIACWNRITPKEMGVAK